MDALENIKSGTLPNADEVYMNVAGPIASLIAKLQQSVATQTTSTAATVALSDSALSAALVKWITQAQPAFANSYPPITQYGSIVSFFSDTTNMPYVRQAMTAYGMQLVPLISINGKLQYGAATWEPYWKLWKAAFYYKTFPIPPNDPSYCTQIGTMLGALSQEIANLKAQQVQGALSAIQYSNTIFVVNDIQSIVTGMYSSLDCVTAVQNQQTAANLAATTAVTNSALSNPTGITGIAGLASNTLLYGIAGVMVIGAIIVIFHHSSKATA